MRQAVVGIVSVAFMVGGLTVLAPFGSEADAGGYYKHKRVNHKDLRADHEQLEYDNRKTHEWLEKIEGMLEPAPVCPEAGGTPDASGRYVTYEAEDPDPKKVCDMRTGVFYEQSPSTSGFQWSSDGVETEAQDHCTNDVGPGWRLPEVVELVSVVDYSASNPATATE